MKKLLALILCLVLMLSLAACGNNDSKDDDDDKDEIKTSQADEEKEDNDEKDDDKDEDVDKDDDKGNDKDNDKDDDEDKANAKFSRGKISGNKYTSEFSGINFTKPSSWEFLSEELVLEMLGFSVGEKTIEALVESGSGYDAVAMNDSGNSVMIGYENLAASGSEEFDEKDYVDAVSQMFSQIGYELGKTEEIEFCGENYLKQAMTRSANGVMITQAYCVRKTGKYMSFVIITATDEDIETILDMFS